MCLINSELLDPQGMTELTAQLPYQTFTNVDY